MKIKFDSDQAYQLEAMQAVKDLFDGQPKAEGQFEFSMSPGGRFWFASDLGFGNRLALDEETILANLGTVQERNGLPVSQELAGLNFTVEMETGTGKTYVYLRTIFELHREYGFSKFIIVVPSVAIREGVLKNIELTREHFQALYGNVPMDGWIYTSKEVSLLRGFATSNQLQIMIINIDAFNKKDIAVIHREIDGLSGRKPIEFVQASQPIVIVDEPQNMETATAREAIASLNPLCTLRYSATHRELYNQVYRLDPVKAYDLRLVKRIEVVGILDEPDFNRPFLRVLSVGIQSRKIKAKVELDVNGTDGPKRKNITLSRNGEDLFEKSGQRAGYQGYVVSEIDAGNKFVEFANGVRLYEGEAHGSHKDQIMQTQVRKAVEEHFEKELKIRRRVPEGERLKVLTLFFIDRVANYHDQDGKIRRWFIEAYNEVAGRPQYKDLPPLPADQVHSGYFAVDGNTPKDTRGNTKADDGAYELIMRDKERLLSLEEPVRFIFSHSALREGWDNPNVFQICTLNETRSEMRKRQEIGRGMRLPVRENGERCLDGDINTLTVVANESYQDFASRLQAEIEEECGVKFDGGRIANRRERRTAKLKKGWQLNEDFKELWERIKHKTRYAVHYDTAKLIELAAEGIKNAAPLAPPKISLIKAEIEMSEAGVEGKVLTAPRGIETSAGPVSIPDLLGYLQRETQLTRATLAEVLIGSGRLAEVATNPQQFVDQAGRALKATLNKLMIDGIKYERIGESWEMALFESKEIQGYLASMVDVKNCIYDVIQFDSELERNFAETLNNRPDIKLFIKLPWWFQVETPVGTYNPDWAIVKQEPDEKVYLVRETKGSEDPLGWRSGEAAKVHCGRRHFKSLDVDFEVVTDADQV